MGENNLNYGKLIIYKIMIDKMMIVQIYKEWENLEFINLDVDLEDEVENGWYEKFFKFFVIILSDMDLNINDTIMISKDKII